MKQAVAAVFLSCAVLSTFALQQATSGHDICHGQDCPKFTVLNTTADWELRRYEATKWVATNDTAMTKSTVNSDMFHKLFMYISGENVKGVKIPMTAPVVTQDIHGAGPNCESDFVMHFMLPHAFWPSPIQPKDDSVFIAEMPAMDVYVRSFGGFAQDEDYLKALKELSDALEKAGLPVKEDFFYEAGYDGPYTFRGRRNEVWLVKN